MGFTSRLCLNRRQYQIKALVINFKAGDKLQVALYVFYWVSCKPTILSSENFKSLLLNTHISNSS